jgi:hypothetical protein
MPCFADPFFSISETRAPAQGFPSVTPAVALTVPPFATA